MTLTMIKQRRDFLAAKSGQSWGTPGFLLLAKLRDKRANDGVSEEFDGPRFGITVTNNTVKRLISPQPQGKGKNKNSLKTDTKRGPVSVYRNKMRRRLKEVLRQVAPELAKPGIDYVIIGRQACLTIDYADLLKDLEKSFKKVHRRIISSSTD
jgi:ribonuclease P protein component